MLKAELRRIELVGVEGLEVFRPHDEDDLSVLLQLIVGTVGVEGADIFDVEVVPPTRLAKRALTGPVSGRHLVVVNRFDGPRLAAWLHEAVNGCSGQDWHAVATAVGRIEHDG